MAEKKEENINIWKYVHTMEEMLTKEIYPELEMVKTNTVLDTYCGGILKNSVNIICGGTGEGKSLLALHTAINLTKENSVLYIQCENPGAVDQTRLKEIENLYEYNKDNFFYVNMKEINKDNELKLKAIFDIAGNNELGVDIIVIDSLQNILKQQTEGGSMYQQGNILSENLTSMALSKTLLMTWQLTRGIKSKKIDDITTDDISLSLGIAMYAATMFVIKKDGANWLVKGIKSRVEEINNKAQYVRKKNAEGQFRFNVKLTNELN